MKHFVTGLAVCFLLTPALSAQTWEQVLRVVSNDAEQNDRFGDSVSLSGFNAVIGAPLDDDACVMDPGCNSGAAYVFAFGIGQIKKLTDASGAALDEFGRAVAIDGDTIVVGAPLDDDGGDGSGSAFVFGRDQGGKDNWGLVKQLTASVPAASDQFGRSVAINGDTIAVGATGHSDAASLAGAVYIFDRNEGGMDNWGEVIKITASDAATPDSLGTAVAISGDTVIATAIGDDAQTGAAYVFGRDVGGASNWGEVTKITASDAASADAFGVSVSLDTDTAVIAAHRNDDACVMDTGCDSGAAYIFERNQGGMDNWGEVTKIIASDDAAGDEFGNSVSISGDVVIVGAPLNDVLCAPPDCDNGNAYIFARDQGGMDNWGEVDDPVIFGSAVSDEVGFSVAISGTTYLVGARFGDDPNGDANTGAVHIFDVATETNLAISKTDNVDPVTAGTSLVYTVTVENLGAGDGRNIIISEQLPTAVSNPVTSGCAEDPDGVPLCTLGTITSGNFNDFTITVDVDPSATGTLNNQAAIFTTTPDSNSADDLVSEDTAVATAADLSVTIDDDVSFVVPGDTINYSVGMNNLGPSDAQDVVITTTLPAGVTLVSTTGCNEDPNGVPTCTAGTVAAGSGGGFGVVATVDAMTTGLLTTQVVITSSTTEDAPGDENASVSIESVDAANIVFTDGFESGDLTLWDGVVGGP